MTIAELIKTSQLFSNETARPVNNTEMLSTINRLNTNSQTEPHLRVFLSCALILKPQMRYYMKIIRYLFLYSQKCLNTDYTLGESDELNRLHRLQCRTGVY